MCHFGHFKSWSPRGEKTRPKSEWRLDGNIETYEYLVTENRILRSNINGRLGLKEEERRHLATIGKQLGRKALVTVATIVKPDTILRWHAKLVAYKFDGSRCQRSPERPPVSQVVEALILRFARENRRWGRLARDMIGFPAP